MYDGKIGEEMNCGVSTACFYPKYTETAVEHLVTNGIKNIEIFANTFSETTAEYGKQLRVLLDAHEARAVAVHPFTSPLEGLLFFSEHERRFLEGIEFYKQTYAPLMQATNAKILVLHGCKKENQLPEKMYFERYAQLREALGKEGITLAQENIGPNRSRSTDFLLRMKDYLKGDVDFVFDTKQALRGEEDIIKMAEAIGESICHVHISDNDKDNHCLPIGKGTFDFRKLIAVLQKAGFDGSFMLELYQNNYAEYQELYDAVALLETYL